jgi:hypothetical protein
MDVTNVTARECRAASRAGAARPYCGSGEREAAAEGVKIMQATYDVRQYPTTRAFVISFLLAASLVIGGAAGFALKGLTQSVQLSPAAPVVVSSLAGPMASGRSAAQLTRIELNDQQSQAQSISVSTAGAAALRSHANPSFGPR